MSVARNKHWEDNRETLRLVTRLVEGETRSHMNTEWKGEMTVGELIEDTHMGRPHVVVIGAGASVAAFPGGDSTGKALPVMDNLVDVVGVGPVLERKGIDYKGRNFETVYSELCRETVYHETLRDVEGKIRAYFREMKLPKRPTMYDHLVLSLREKDLIASFNWDPFLYQACWRNHREVSLPHTAYLHGNVAVGYCPKDNRMGLAGTQCSKCGDAFIDSKLVFPVTRKDYAEDPFIASEWRDLRTALKNAYLLTIFGYGAPQSDVEAIRLMKEAWGSVATRNLEQVEIIDIKSEEDLSATWQDFIHTHHYRVRGDFYDSCIANFPRRTCEAEWNASMECRFLSLNPIPRSVGFDGLWAWYRALATTERRKPAT